MEKGQGLSSKVYYFRGKEISEIDVSASAFPRVLINITVWRINTYIRYMGIIGMGLAQLRSDDTCLRSISQSKF